jgi:hypothetical protein
MTAEEKTAIDRWEIFGLIILLILTGLAGLGVVLVAGRWDAALN